MRALRILLQRVKLGPLIYYLNGTFEVEAFSGPHVELQCNGIQLFLRMHRQVRTFGLLQK